MPIPPSDRSAFRERLGMYLLGIAIGCAILGLIFTMRRQAARPRSLDPAAPPATGPTSP